jgi:hypothetical protein
VERSETLKTETQAVMQLEKAVEEKVIFKEDLKVSEANLRIQNNQTMSNLSDEARSIEKSIVAAGQELHRLESQKLMECEAAKKKLLHEQDLLQLVQKKAEAAQQELLQRNQQDALSISDLVDAISKNRTILDGLQEDISSAKSKAESLMLENTQLMKDLDASNKQIKALDSKLQHGPLKFGK